MVKTRYSYFCLLCHETQSHKMQVSVNICLGLLGYSPSARIVSSEIA